MKNKLKKLAASIAAIVTIAMVTFAFKGCTENKTVSDFSEEMISISELTSVGNENIVSISDISNLNVDDKSELLLPCNISEIYSYTSKISQEYSMKNYYDDFSNLFSYIFPNRKMKNDYFLYWGGSSSIEYDDKGNITKNLNKVQDNYDRLIANEEGRAYFIYDESWFQDSENWNSAVCLESGNPIGYGFLTINKGSTIKLSNIKNTDPITNKTVYPRLESFNPSEYFEKIGTYSSDSTEIFKLYDKEMKISDAVAVYENYIKSLPCTKEKNCNTVVRSVDVYKVTNDVYGFYFNTNKEYKGVQFDYMPNETKHSEYDRYTTYWGFGFMVESNDVDIISGAYFSENSCNVKTYSQIIGLESAARIIGSEMSDNVVFDVKAAELIYTSVPKTDDNGFIDIENQSFDNAPAWKFTLYNPNDKLTYVCYVDAADGGNFRYYIIYDQN